MKKYILLVLTIFFLNVTAVYAQPAETTEQKTEEEACKPEPKDFSDKPKAVARKYERRQADIDVMDKNCDGVLQPEELQAGIDNRFKAADMVGEDEEGDGTLTTDETAKMISQFKKGAQETYGKHTDRKARKMEIKIKKMDKNDDGKISEDEYKSYYGKRYEKMDKNGDGVISVDEYKTDVEGSRRRRRGHN